METEGIFFNIEDYKLEQTKIGEGCFASTYIAVNLKDGKKVVAKIFKTNVRFTAFDQQNLMRESTILYKMQHPSILSFFGLSFISFHYPQKFQPTILTEYCPNGTLKDILDKEKRSLAPIDWTPTKKYISLLGIANAMDYLHKNGVIHRDLKTSNVLLDENLYPKVYDFGFSRMFPFALDNSMLMSMTTNIGTPLFMAPELFGDEIVTSLEPYHDLMGRNKHISLFKKVISGIRPQFPDGFNKKMVNLISMCWDAIPTNRPSFEEIFNILSTDFSYTDDSIDEDEIEDYIKMIIESKK